MNFRIFLTLSILGLFFGGLMVLENRSNALRLTDNIFAKDRAAQPVDADLKELESYVASHMGSSVEFMLADSYNRAAAKAVGTLNTGSNSQLYSQAQASCANQGDSVAQSRCVQKYLTDNAQPSPNPQPTAMPNAASFVKSYKSPFWTPDLAGVLLLGSAASFVVAFAMSPRVTRKKRNR